MNRNVGHCKLIRHQLIVKSTHNNSKLGAILQKKINDLPLMYSRVYYFYVYTTFYLFSFVPQQGCLEQRKIKKKIRSASQLTMTGHDNPTFLDDNLSVPGDYRPTYFPQRPTKFDPDAQQQTCNDAAPPPNTLPPDKPSDIPPRETWGKGVEFLMSCIAMSVGLGNVWRFPFTALNNGGGAFLIPYLIVLLLVGRPIYYMEMAIGQFSSRGSVKVYDFAPAMRGAGYGQIIATFWVMTYYSSVMAITVRYLSESFSSTLPWTWCRDTWSNTTCVDSLLKNTSHTLTTVSAARSSSDLFYQRNFILELVDYFGASNIVYVLAIGELIALHYIYGLGRFCRDIEFMIGKRPGIYWRLTWGFITPVLLLIIFIYTLAIYSPLTYRGQSYPSAAYAAGWTLAAFGVLQLPIWAAVAVIREDGKTWREKFVRAFKPRSNWGPVVPAIAEKYHKFRATEDSKELFANDGFFNKIKRTLFG
uniref:Transporter n=2 Tax=Lutzomyia longipalpis TaxID=7200 RepID=A0A1B0F034_LUTLO